MFKWILGLIIAFLAAWIFARDHIPLKIRDSGVGKALHTILFPLEYNLHGNREGKFSRMITPISPEKFRQVMASLDKSTNPAVIFFYDTGSLLSRYTLADINQLAKKHAGKNGAAFFVVDFEEDPEKLSVLLNGFSNLYFRPLIATKGVLKEAEYFYIKREVQVVDVPTLIVKANVEKNYNNVSIDFGTKDEVEKLLSQQID